MDEQETELSRRLWSGEFDPTDESYRQTVLEQYRLYVEMADRVSSRRASANTYFLSLNTALAAIVMVVAGDRLADASVWLLLAGLVVLLTECVTWFAVIRSYRQLNSAKWRVVGAIEQRLPASPWWNAEWWAAGEGRDARKYLPLSHIEQWVPVIFMVAYTAGFIALAYT